ncbi:MAG: hypothetical protein J5639_09255 [Bacteroidales bacterium]|nr:hypothetical protein [Bacteroidales bacterium]
MKEKVEATELVTMRGFTEAFWRLYSQGGQTQEDVYLTLDGIYFARFREHRFKSFDAFRKRRNRSIKKKK